jgi:peptidyl carrier protein
MRRVRPHRDVCDDLLAFIRERFLAGDPGGELDERTPLLATGVLDSLNTAVLMSFIRDELGAEVPFGQINAQSFASVASIAAMICALPAAPDS